MSVERERRRLRKATEEAIKHFPEGYVVIVIAKPPMSMDVRYMGNVDSKVDIHTLMQGMADQLKKEIAQ